MYDPTNPAEEWEKKAQHAVISLAPGKLHVQVKTVSPLMTWMQDGVPSP